jgi:predicted transcriptional regulator
MSPRRSKLEIRLTMLSAIQDGVDKPTRIMYAANLSWKPTQRILAQLYKQGLINEIEESENVKSKRHYEITEKGVAVLKYFDDAKKLLPINDIYSHM